MKLAYVVLGLGLTLGACGKSDPAVVNDVPDAGGDDPGVDANVPDGWTKLISRSWTLAAGVTDNYQCRRIKIPEDMWIAGFQAVAPLGTHHEVLTITESTSPPQVGDYACSAGQLDQRMLYASGVGTTELDFPAGVAIKLKKDSYININLHLFNSGDTALAGESGILVKQVPQAQVQKEIGMLFGGTRNFSIPADGLEHTFSGSCTTKAWEIFALWPHMHQIANHQKVLLTHGQTTDVLLDESYAFGDQKYYPMTARTVAAGDQLSVLCTYNNPVGGSTVNFGDSSTDEMCFTGMYTYPAPSFLFECALN